MALIARDGHAPSLFALLDGCLDYGGYVEEPGGRVAGLLYRQFADFTRDCFHLHADVIIDLDPARITRELDQGRLVMASVHKEIRRPEHDPPASGSHLVNPEDTGELIRVCAAGGHLVETPTGGSCDVSTANGRKRFRDDANDAAYEVDHGRERVLAARAEVAADGRWLGGKRPFGWELDKNPMDADGKPMLDDDGNPARSVVQQPEEPGPDVRGQRRRLRDHLRDVDLDRRHVRAGARGRLGFPGRGNQDSKVRGAGHFQRHGISFRSTPQALPEAPKQRNRNRAGPAAPESPVFPAGVLRPHVPRCALPPRSRSLTLERQRCANGSGGGRC
jgi:hypothetical protein